MSSRAIVRRNNQVGRRTANRNRVVARAAVRAAARAGRRLIATYGRGAARAMVRTSARGVLNRIRARRRNKHGYKAVKANVAGTTHTTSRLITHKSTKEIRSLRKMFRDNPNKMKFVNRFAFGWMGAEQFSKTIWYSVCHLKFNNVYDYITHAPADPTQTLGKVNYSYPNAANMQRFDMNPAKFIYIGKCTFQYELYNPTNYIMTVYIYDLVCKHDTPYQISYVPGDETVPNSGPEHCMQKGAFAHKSDMINDTANWMVADQTEETNLEDNIHDTVWNTVGMKPTDYFLFNTIWKVKGVKKIILPPASSHHHVVVYNPKKKITLGNLIYPRMNIDSSEHKFGIGGLTQATLFGFEGQISINAGQESDTTELGTLPGKLLVKCIRKITTYNFPMNTDSIISKNYLVKKLEHPTIMTELQERDATAT